MTVTNRLALAREQLVFVALESPKGTMKEPTAGEMVRVINAPAFNQMPEYFDDEQFRDTRSKESRIRGRFLAGEWNLETYIKPSGTCGVAPEAGNLLKAALGATHSRVLDAVVSEIAKQDVITDGSNSTTRAYFADTSMFRVGDRVKITQTTPAAVSYRVLTTVNVSTDYIEWATILSEAVDDATDIEGANNQTTAAQVANAAIYVVGDAIRIHGETTFVTALSTVTDVITFAPALTLTAAPADAIKAGVHYTPANDPLSMSIWHFVGHTMFVIVGASCDKLVADVKGKEISKFTFSGKFMKYIHTGTDEVGVGGINDAATTLPVADGTKFAVDSIINIESETMLVTAVSGNSLTVTRGYKSTSPAAHLAEVAITPWHPTGYADVGEPVHGRMGDFRVDNIDVTILDGQVTLENGIKYYEEEKTGTDFAEDFDAVKLRDVKATINLFLRTNDAKYFQYALDQTQSIVELPAGVDDGLICVLRMPKGEWSQPDLSADTEIKAKIEMQALASTSGNDELAIHFL